MLIALDTETTGLDIHHGCKPFLITITDDKFNTTYWEWRVNPETRMPIPLKSDLNEIEDIIHSADCITLHNSKFDVSALAAVRPRIGKEWPWDKTKDTLLDAHLLCSNQKKGLTELAIKYLRTDLQPYEDKVKAACTKARRIAKSKFPEILRAELGVSTLPTKSAWWKCDMWLPRLIAERLDYDDDHPWWTVTADYANSDSISSVALRLKFDKMLEEQGLTEFSNRRHKLLPITYNMESVGITIHPEKLRELQNQYTEQSNTIKQRCENYARSDGYELEMPKGGSNNQLKAYAQGCIKIGSLVPKDKRVRKRFFGKTGEPKLDKNCNAHYQLELINQHSPHHKHVKFLSLLSEKRSRDTALSYLDSYKRFWIPTGITNSKEQQLWYRIHPSLNIVGTNTLRWSSSNPNEQNISKKEGFNLRYCFGPTKGREWWSIDAQNLELRLPAYLANETEMIELFEQPDKPPYFGSYHLLIFDTIHTTKWDRTDEKGLLKAKDKFKSTWYQWTKNGNFAVQYGAVEESGTADLAYKVKGAHRTIKSRFTNISKLADECIRHAEEFGYVETVPDKTLDPDRGYPLICTRDDWGRIKPTVPLSYKIQGSAMWWMQSAMIRCNDYLTKINKDRKPEHHCRMIIQVHDELVFDFPKSKENPKIVNRIKTLMEKGGDDIGIPTPVSIEYHPNTWNESEDYN